MEVPSGLNISERLKGLFEALPSQEATAENLKLLAASLKEQAELMNDMAAAVEIYADKNDCAAHCKLQASALICKFSVTAVLESLQGRLALHSVYHTHLSPGQSHSEYYRENLESIATTFVEHGQEAKKAAAGAAQHMITAQLFGVEIF